MEDLEGWTSSIRQYRNNEVVNLVKTDQYDASDQVAIKEIANEYFIRKNYEILWPKTQEGSMSDWEPQEIWI